MKRQVALNLIKNVLLEDPMEEVDIHLGTPEGHKFILKWTSRFFPEQLYNVEMIAFPEGKIGAVAKELALVMKMDDMEALKGTRDALNDKNSILIGFNMTRQDAIALQDRMKAVGAYTELKALIE